MYQLKVKDHIDSAHFIMLYDGKCARPHGHRWDIEVAVQGEELDRLNMVVDFKLLKTVLHDILDKVDHYFLNDVLDEPNLTAEVLAAWVYGQVEDCPANFDLVSVTVWESPDCCVVYIGNDKDV